MHNNITFFFPYPDISGVPILFANMANYLLKHTDIKIHIIDYKNGALIRTCDQHPNLNFIEFTDFQDCVLDIETYLVIQAGVPSQIRNELKIGEQVKIIQWAAFEYNLVPYLYGPLGIHTLQKKYFNLYLVSWYLDFKKAKLLSAWVQKMIARGAIAFMSKKMYDVTEKYLQFNEPVSITYLPLISGGHTDYSSEHIQNKAKSISQCLELAWLGRLGDFKIHILNYSIKLLSKIAFENKIVINFHIIGEGELYSLLELNHNNEFFNIIYVGGLEKDNSDAYIHEKIHALFAMGTSSIDGARVGLPVVLLDYCYHAVEKDYIFRYLHHTRDYDLGHPMVEEDFAVNNDSLKRMVLELVNNYISLSNQSFGYYTNNHSTERTAGLLLDLLANNSYCMSEVPMELRSESIVRKTYKWYLKNIKKRYY